MIDIRDLMMGNYVSIGGIGIVQIDGVIHTEIGTTDVDVIVYKGNSYSNVQKLEYVSITAEWLDKCGKLGKTDDGWYFRTDAHQNQVEIVYEGLDGYEIFIDGGTPFAYFQHRHQLQNLFQCLTGKVLE